MADRYPLVANSSTRQIEELATNDNLSLLGNSIVGASTITANRFVGDLVGGATTATFLSSGANIITGTIDSDRLSGSYDISVTTASFLSSADNILSGTVPRARLAGDYDISITGTASTSNALTNASQITGGIVPSQRLSGVYNIDITGTAYSSVGAALSLTISNQVDNTVQYLTYTKEVDTDTSVFASPDGLVYNPGTNTVGIGTSLPDSDVNLDVHGIIKSGVTTSTSIFAQTLTAGQIVGVTTVDDNTALAVAQALKDNNTIVDDVTLNNPTITGVATIFDADIIRSDSEFTHIGIATASSLSIGSTEVLDSDRTLKEVAGIDTVTAETFRTNLGLDSLSGINVTGLSTFQDIDVVGITSLANVNVAGTSNLQTVNAVNYLGNGAGLSGIVTALTAGIGVSLSGSTGKVNIDAYFPVGKTIFVTQNGNDSNTGLSENNAKLTIKAAAAIAETGDTVKVYPGYYAEDNPILLEKNVAVEGTELRNCQVRPLNAGEDLFHVNNGCHVTDLSFVGGQSTNGAAIIAFRPLKGVAGDRFFDGARMIRYNLDFIAREAVGFITSSDYVNPPFEVTPGGPTDCADDIKDVLKAVMFDITRGGNSKCVGAGKSYFSEAGALLHITGTDGNGYSVKDATLAAMNKAAGIAISCINNVSWTGGYQNEFYQVKDVGIIADSNTGFNTDIGSCANVLSAVNTCIGIVTTIIGAGTTGNITAGINTTYPGAAGAGTSLPNDPSYSPGVGPILQGPYIRNCTNFVPGSIGMKVDGFDAEPGDKDDIGVTGSMSVDSYTQFNQGGIGVSVSNGAYAQLVSLFTICNEEAVVTTSGGQLDLTNSNSSFGNFGLVSRGVGNNYSKSIYTYTAGITTTANFGQNVVTVSGVGTYRPYDGQVVYFDTLFKSVVSIRVDNGGSGYTTPPRITIAGPTGDNGITAQATATVVNGAVTEINVVTAGSQYISAPAITIESPVSGTTALASVDELSPIYYRVAEATLPSAGITTITLAQNLNNTVNTDSTVYFARLSQQLASSHSFEFVGSGNEILSAKPALGGVTIQENEVVKAEGGEVIYTSTDQAGNFRIGDGITINQSTGSLTGTDFTKALFTTMTPFILALSD